MFKMDLEEAEEPEIKFPTSIGSQKKQENSRKTSTSTSLALLKLLTVWITTNWKILKDTEPADHLTCLLRNLYASQEATVRTGYETTDWFKIWKGVCQGCMLSPCLFNLYAFYPKIRLNTFFKSIQDIFQDSPYVIPQNNLKLREQNKKINSIQAGRRQLIIRIRLRIKKKT